MGPRPSFFWKSLKWGKSLLCEGIRYRVGDGANITAFRDKWIPRELTFKPISNPPEDSDIKVSEFISNRQWNMAKLESYFNQEDLNSIVSIPLSSNPSNDSLTWHSFHNGNYCVKSGYKLAYNIKFPDSSYESSSHHSFSNRLWNLTLHSKIKMFFWQAIKDRLPTRINLLRRGIDCNTSCPLCSAAVETLEHIFIFCPRVKSIWADLLPSAINNLQASTSFHDYWSNWIATFSNKELSLICIICWAIWCWKNFTGE